MSWIKLADRMPEKGQKCVITDGEHFGCVEYAPHTAFGDPWWPIDFGGYEWDWDWDLREATHWMPLVPPEVTP